MCNIRFGQKIETRGQRSPITCLPEGADVIWNYFLYTQSKVFTRDGVVRTRDWGQLKTAVLVTRVQHWRKAFLPATPPRRWPWALPGWSPIIPERIGVNCEPGRSRITWELGLWASMWEILWIPLIGVGSSELIVGSVCVSRAGEPSASVHLGTPLHAFPGCGCDVTSSLRVQSLTSLLR